MLKKLIPMLFSVLVFSFSLVSLRSQALLETMKLCETESQMIGAIIWLMHTDKVNFNEKANFYINSDKYGIPIFFRGITALHIASILNFSNLATFLLENGAYINSIDDCLSTPFHYACFFQNNEVLKVFLSNSSLNINLPNWAGHTGSDWFDLYIRGKSIILQQCSINNAQQVEIPSSNSDLFEDEIIQAGSS